MDEEGKHKFTEMLDKTSYVVCCAVLAALLAVAVGVLVETVKCETASLGRFLLHDYLLIGAAMFFVLWMIPRLRGNIRWLMKFTHEFTHLIFAIIFFRKIYRFKVDDNDSFVSYSGGWFGYHAITLSPYCIPVFTLALLPWRFTTGTAFPLYLHFIDALLGFTFAFHICTWICQVRLHQSDISGPGTVKSLLCIALCQIISLCLVVMTPSSGVLLAIRRVFVDFPGAVMSVFF